MRKSLALVLGLVFASIALGAAGQTHDNMTEKSVRDQVTFYKPIRVGSTVLAAGEYLIQCDRTTITFSHLEESADGPGHWRRVGKPLALPCKGEQLAAPRESTELAMPIGPDGIAVLMTLYIRGSNVAHVFN